eukprot:SAG11_NODE_2279_length_3579_cov_6.588506_1_plen_344_part_00
MPRQTYTLPRPLGWALYLSIILPVVSLPTKAWASSPCETDEDCNLNGLCKSGSCVCAPEWRGDDCGVLNLLPARPSPGSGYDEPGTSSWGGSIVEDGGRFHMMVSRFKGHCGLNSWQQNSEIIHATSEDPEGPYTFNTTILPVFAHGPSVRKTSSGYLMMHLGCGVPFKPYIADCTNGSTPKGSGGSGGNGTSGCNQFNVSVMTSPTIWGPWSKSEQVFLSSGSQDPSWYVPSGRQFSNPAPHIKADGSILCAYRADSRKGGEHVSIANAPAVAGPYLDERTAPAVGQTKGQSEGESHLVAMVTASGERNCIEPPFATNRQWLGDARAQTRFYGKMNEGTGTC